MELCLSDTFFASSHAGYMYVHACGMYMHVSEDRIWGHIPCQFTCRLHTCTSSEVDIRVLSGQDVPR